MFTQFVEQTHACLLYGAAYQPKGGNMKLRVLFISMFLFVLPAVYAANKIPQFNNYPVEEIYTGKNHPLVMDSFGKSFRTRLRDAIEHEKPDFAGHFIVVKWGCGSGGCNSGAVIDAKTGKAYVFPVALSSVFPLKPEFEKEDGQEHLYKLNSRLMVFAGNLEGAKQGDGDDTVEFYEFKNDKFVFIRSIPYNHKGKE